MRSHSKIFVTVESSLASTSSILHRMWKKATPSKTTSINQGTLGCLGPGMILVPWRHPMLENHKATKILSMKFLQELSNKILLRTNPWLYNFSRLIQTPWPNESTKKAGHNEHNNWINQQKLKKKYSRNLLFFSCFFCLNVAYRLWGTIIKETLFSESQYPEIVEVGGRWFEWSCITGCCFHFCPSSFEKDLTFPIDIFLERLETTNRNICKIHFFGGKTQQLKAGSSLVLLAPRSRAAFSKMRGSVITLLPFQAFHFWAPQRAAWSLKSQFLDRWHKRGRLKSSFTLVGPTTILEFPFKKAKWRIHQVPSFSPPSPWKPTPPSGERLRSLCGDELWNEACDQVPRWVKAA